MHTTRLTALVFVAATATASLAVRAADVESLAGRTARKSPVAQQCLADLRAFEDELARFGFGVLAPSGYGTGYTGYGTAYGMSGTPRQKMQSLRDAAYVYAFDGNEQSCQTVLASMRQVYEEHQKLTGLESDDPDARMAWRRAHLARATPVTEMDSLMRADIVIGADIRTPKDEELGEIEDVVLDPARQTIAYVLASRGGFLGLGEELVAVRWADLRATTDHEIYVLDASPEAFAAAPKVERGASTRPRATAGAAPWISTGPASWGNGKALRMRLRAPKGAGAPVKHKACPRQLQPRQMDSISSAASLRSRSSCGAGFHSR